MPSVILPVKTPSIVSTDDTLSSIINDCVRIAIVMLLGHFATCMYVHETQPLNGEFVNGFMFYIFGTIIFYVFFYRKMSLPDKVIFPSH